MAVIALKLALALFLAVSALAVDPREEITGELAGIASDFSSSNADGIIKRMASTMPGRGALEENLRDMLQVAQVATTIEVREWTAAGARTIVILDWFLEMRRAGDGSVLATQRRRQLVRAEWEKQGKRWKIVALKPLEFFAPPASQ